MVSDLDTPPTPVYPLETVYSPNPFPRHNPHPVSPVYRNGLGAGAFPGEEAQLGEGGRVGMESWEFGSEEEDVQSPMDQRVGF